MTVILVGLCILTAIALWRMPHVYPRRIGETLAWAVPAAAAAASASGVSISPASFGAAGSKFAIAIVILALVPPVLGSIESRWKAGGERIFAPDRFRGHLVTNLVGGLAVATFLHLSSSTEGVRSFVRSWQDSPAYNVVLPLAVLVVFVFVRAQQVRAAGPLIDEASHPELHVTGYSLAHWHQLANVVYLIVATFTVSTSVMYLFAYSLVRSSQGRPLELSWVFVFAFCTVLGFVLVCGTQWSNSEPAVYLTFLTGTPAVLVAIAIWLSVLQSSGFRNTVGAIVIGVGYTTYCALAIVAAQRGRVQWHYFTALGLSLTLAALVGAAYLR